MRSLRGTLAYLLVTTAVGCSPTLPDRTFEPGVEHLPGPAWYLVRIEPDEAVEGRDIVILGDGEEVFRVADLLRSTDRAENHGNVLMTDGSRRFVDGISLPVVLSAAVDGVPCAGVLELVVDRETDATLSIDGDGCTLRRDRVHPPEVVDHGLREVP